MHFLCGKKISGLFTIPSGIVTTYPSIMEKISQIPEIGIITTKSIGPEPREGNREPIITQPSPFTIMNAVGLTNPGSKEFTRKLSEIKFPRNKFLLCSIFGADEYEFCKVAKDLMDYADGFELNVSCPHAEGYGQAIGKNEKLVYKITKRVSSFEKPVFVKISPNVDVRKITESAVDGGASGIVAINTIGPFPYEIDGNPVLSKNLGGMSGKKALPIGIKCIKEISETTNLPIVGCGGINCAQDVRMYKNAGASFYGIGSSLIGMNSEEIKKFFHEIGKDLTNSTNNAAKLLKRVDMNFSKLMVENKTDLSENMFILEFRVNLETKPGQFIFLWIPGKGEKPFSVLDDKPLRLLIQKRGCLTEELSRLKAGDSVYLRGPYGKSPESGGKILLVGGGTGVAGIYLFAKESEKVMTLLGAKDKNHLAFKERFKKLGKVYVATEDGSLGHKGFVTDLLENVIKEFKPDYCLNCGPPGMVKAAIEKESLHMEPERILSSVDFLTKCGVGLCGSCATSNGYRSCVDGTFLRKDQL